MYKDILKLLVELKTYVFATALSVLGLIGLEVFGLIRPGYSIFANTFFMCCLAYVAHHHILTGGKSRGDFNVPNIISFLGVLLVIGLIASVLPLVGSILMATAGQPDLTSILFVLLLNLIASTGVFLLLGTAVPAHVAGHQTGIRAAYRRGRLDFWSLAWDFVRGPIALSLAFGAIVGSVVGILGGFVQVVAGADIAQLIIGFGLTVLLVAYYACNVVIGAYILCRSYMRSLAREQLAIEPSD